ncbi:DUF2892 domain-containing protein [Spirosoma sp. KCTC 42546]|uniref:YgaP family membrane protein n=1 Tax=Spirosoma sp. KCTC 42546 TaxID=2520506 RepID=UPI0011599F16|nr:DUF2892 domain-containing protein [Spirosoma sp. KCTC 42546]QDK77250.1 DUF2892 domain-containing protein [Spirosoma sp. KCTC 42546]
MKPNLGNVDIVLRLVVGVSLMIILFVKEITFPLNWLLICLSFVLLITGISGSCPLYRILDISTRLHRKENRLDR